jgi:hypothetical protein
LGVAKMPDWILHAVALLALGIASAAVLLN